MPEGGITTASTVVAAILNLADKMSPKLISVGKHWDNLSKSEQRAAKSAMVSMNAMQKSADKYMTKFLKWGAVGIATGVGAALTMGFKEAFDLESYRSQLETATKDTERAAKVMTYAVKMAGATPYESGELVAASSALEMAGLKTETYLTTLGDVAAGSNKTIADVQTQFVKAFSTGYSADFFRSINVSAKSFEDFARSNKLATGTLADTQTALKKFLDEKFGGGMEKLSHTVKGAWASITDIAKISITRIVGMGEDGTVRTGSALDKLRNKMVSISNALDKWQESGKLDELSRELGDGLAKVWDIGEKTFETIYKYRELIEPLALFAAGVWAITKGMAAFKAIATAVRMVMLLLNGTLLASPVGLVAAALAALGITAYSILTYDNGTSTPGQHESSSGRTHSGGGGNFEESKHTTKRRWFDNAAYELGFQMKMRANGTQYHSGGLALVGERGPELVNLPGGSRVTTAEKTAKLGGQTVINNYITINGAEKSDDELAALVAKRILESTENS